MKAIYDLITLFDEIDDCFSAFSLSTSDSCLDFILL